MTKTTGWVTSPFLYRGPTSGVTLRRAGLEDMRVMLHDGATVELPCDHPYVERLEQRGFVARVTPATPAKPATLSAPARTDSTDKPEPRTSSSSRRGATSTDKDS